MNGGGVVLEGDIVDGWICMNLRSAAEARNRGSGGGS